MKENQLKLAAVSDGLVEALREGLWPDGRRRAKGVGRDSTEYRASALHGIVSIRVWPYRLPDATIPEPDGVVWSPIPTTESPVQLEKVSPSLQRALEDGRWPDGRRLASGVGPDGLRYDAFRDGCLVCIYEHNEFAVVNSLISEPEDAIWQPYLPNRGPVKFEEVSEGLRSALQDATWPDGLCRAVGVGPDGMRFDACLRDGRVLVEEQRPSGAMTPLIVSEPDGVVWRSCLPNQEPIKLDAISERLRIALGKGLWPDGRHHARGEGPDGREYDAWLRCDEGSLRRVVFIYEVIAGTPTGLRLPEPANVLWEAPFTEEDWLRLGAVSGELRRVLDERSPDGKRYSAIGEAPEGTKYCACVRNDDLVFIDYADDRILKNIAFVNNRPFARERIPIAEPPSVVWKPYFSPTSTSQQRPWWQFWK